MQDFRGPVMQDFRVPTWEQPLPEEGLLKELGHTDWKTGGLWSDQVPLKGSCMVAGGKL
jgi:hypothetical protein